MSLRERIEVYLRATVAALPIARRIEDEIEQRLGSGLRHRLSDLVEERSPWLSRRVLEAASNITEPFVVGMGLRVETLKEDSITVRMPSGWRNQGVGGALHAGALCTLGEFTWRLYWEHHLDLKRADLDLYCLQLSPIGQSKQNGLSRLHGAVRATYHNSVAEREQTLYQLRANGQVEVEGEVGIYDEGGRLIAQVELVWLFRRQLRLNVARVPKPGHGPKEKKV